MIRMSIVAILLVRNAMPKLEKFNSNYTYLNWKLIYIVFINYQKLYIAQIIPGSLLNENVTQFTNGHA